MHTSASASEAIKIGLSVVQDPHYVPIWVAHELGYFREFGGESDPKYFGGGGIALNAMREKAVDIVALSPVAAAQSVQRGEMNICFAGRGETPNGWHVLVPANSPIRTLADLAGKRVGITGHGGTSNFYALWSARRGGGEVELVPLGARVPDELVDGKIEAAPVWPNEAIKLILSGRARSIANLAELMPPNLPACWATRQDVVDQKPEVLRIFLKGMAKALERLHADRAFALEYIRKVTKETDERVVASSYGDIVRRMRPDGIITLEIMRNSLELGAQAGLRDLPPAERTFTARFVPASAR